MSSTTVSMRSATGRQPAENTRKPTARFHARAPSTVPTTLAGDPATMVRGATSFSTSDPAAT